MPTYLYECSKHGEFEDFHSMSKIYKECPKCKEEGVEQGEFRQLINASTKGKVELYGNDLVEKVQNETKQLSKDIHSKEALYANVLGPDKYHKMQTQMDKAKRERR